MGLSKNTLLVQHIVGRVYNIRKECNLHKTRAATFYLFHHLSLICEKIACVRQPLTVFIIYLLNVKR